MAYGSTVRVVRLLMVGGAPADPILEHLIRIRRRLHNPASLNRPNPAVKQTIPEPDRAANAVEERSGTPAGSRPP